MLGLIRFGARAAVIIGGSIAVGFWREIDPETAKPVANFLTAAGLMWLIELGFGQSERLRDEVSAVSELTLEDIAQDLQGIPRVAVLRRH